MPTGGIPGEALPTPPPSYIDNLQSRLIKARERIFPASLKMILKTKYPLLVRRPAPETLVQPDDVIGEHRAGENSPSSLVKWKVSELDGSHTGEVVLY